MRIGVVSQVRNEADVLPAFLPHLAAFADVAVLMDHGSVDGSLSMLEAACRSRTGWAAWRVAVPGHHQALFATFAARYLLRIGADRVLFLDADEFVDLPNRDALVAVLGRMDQPGDIGVWTWRNCVPDRLGGPLASGDAVWQAPVPSRYPKVVLSAALFRASGGQAGPAVGAHFMQGIVGPTYNVLLGTLLHVPLRSAPQARRKVVLGSLAELARSDRCPTDSSHWAEMLACIATGALDDDALRGMAAHYGEPGAAAERLSQAGLAGRGFSRRPLDVMRAELPGLPSPLPIDPWQAVADALCNWSPSPSAGLVLEVANGVLRAAVPSSWPDAFLAGTPLLDLARTVLLPGSRVLALGTDAAALGLPAATDPSSGPFDAVLVNGMTPERLATAHAALLPGGLLIGVGDTEVADLNLLGTVADALQSGYGRPAPYAPDRAWHAVLDQLFRVERQQALGGAVMRSVLSGMADRFDWAKAQDATAGHLVAALDRLLVRHGVVPSGCVAVVARRVD